LAAGRIVRRGPVSSTPQPPKFRSPVGFPGSRITTFALGVVAKDDGACLIPIALTLGGRGRNLDPIRRRDQTAYFHSALLRAAGSHRYSKDLDMQNGRKTPRHSNPGTPSTSRPIRWTPNTDRPKPNGFGNAQRSYERYLALAQEEVRCGNIVAAENYYQHAEHYYRSMSGDRGGAS
jgi:hypothetical protein